jgi:hypothetical protein
MCKEWHGGYRIETESGAHRKDRILLCDVSAVVGKEFMIRESVQHRARTVILIIEGYSSGKEKAIPYDYLAQLAPNSLRYP